MSHRKKIKLIFSFTFLRFKLGTLETVKGMQMCILKTNEVVKIIGLSKVTIWRMEKSGTFPKRINLSDRRAGWIESEILEWLESRPKGICTEPVTQPFS